jgi:hypothetical protein
MILARHPEFPRANPDPPPSGLPQPGLIRVHPTTQFQTLSAHPMLVFAMVWLLALQPSVYQSASLKRLLLQAALTASLSLLHPGKAAQPALALDSELSLPYYRIF